jgi:hypothetical protein
VGLGQAALGELLDEVEVADSLFDDFLSEVPFSDDFSDGVEEDDSLLVPEESEVAGDFDAPPPLLDFPSVRLSLR